ncbi:hypothetical protein [Geoalkalibacter sp.]|jgi:hypothetical protein|uniref:hypothetical protein n=1 Tax=Geoalkalibacter sp. TaxID=3041440 RepID=UPI00272E1602|nr:hypothetical protein [Geoalkalibacter sp.]
MNAAKWLVPMGIGVMLLAGQVALAAGQQRMQQQLQIQDREQVQEQIYGSQMMSDEERAAYQARMKAAQSEEERERIRAEHHEQMKIRAKEQGISLPDEPPQKGMGMGMGKGMGPGGGMGGQGPGKGRY